ncbi:MAG: phosphoesterase PA-phosphatase, partial [Anaerotignum sp.]|nr:phosphoesterase PA-phosphatase [Anaerotignum sp.]
MKQNVRKSMYPALCLLLTFAVWTILLGIVDVHEIGPQGSWVGFAALNQFIHNKTGVNMVLYTITDWLGIVPVGVAFGFALLGLVQWIQRGHLLKVDRSILILGGFYLVVMAFYVFFEWYVVNFRPVLIDGRLEASYPSS